MRHLDANPLTGMIQKMDYSDSEKKLIVRTEQEVSGILDRNIKLQNADAYKKQSIDNNFQHVAEIPLVVVHQWMKEGIDITNPDHWPAVKRKLQDPENRYLRTTLGKI